MSLIIPGNGTRARRSPRWGLVGNANSMDRLFDELWRDFSRTPAASVGGSVSRFVPHLDLTESKDEYRVTAELPGLDREEFEILFEEDVLTLKGEKKSREKSEDERFRRAETRSGAFERKVRFGRPVDADGVVAVHKNGVLEITVPKVAEPEPEVRNIPVESR